jgi:hypothetical protein
VNRKFSALDISSTDIYIEIRNRNRIYSTVSRQAFVTLKDHKENFENNPKCRLINPTKAELGKVSKHILSDIVKIVKEKTKVNHWQNTDEVIMWFKNLKDKNRFTFIQFDICDFYSSIGKPLLTKVINWASKYVYISDEAKEIIFQTKKSLLFDDKQPWQKKDNKSFDVTMGSFDGAEICELIGLYLLSLLTDLGITVGLYRDDGLAVCSARARQVETLKKKICSIFRENNLKITIEANKSSVNFLDVNLNLNSGIFKPYMKPNDTPLYVDSKSNHPPSILKNIPLSVNKRLNNISANEAVFNEAAKPYQEALDKSGYSHKLKFENQNPNHGGKKRPRGRRITWFNPPFSSNVKTNIGGKFLRIIEKCFPADNPLSKIFNKNTVKISYKCMQNVKQKISMHNNKVKKQEEQVVQTPPGCNCRKFPCPLNNGCLVDKVVYKATVSTNDSVETYTGLTGNTFKERYGGHKTSFNLRRYAKSTTLSKYVWKQKDENKNYDVDWSIIDRAPSFNPTTRSCRLCLKEKFYIMFYPSAATLNDRSEFFSTCRHRLQLLLYNT